jgi:hypothetical protein
MEQTVQLPGADSTLKLARACAGRPAQSGADRPRAGHESGPPELGRNPRDASSQQLRSDAGRNQSPGKPSSRLWPHAIGRRRTCRCSSDWLVNELAGDRVTRYGPSRTPFAAVLAIDVRRHPDLSELRLDPRYVGIMALAPKPAVQ